MALTAELQASFGDGGFSLSSTFDGLSSLLSDIDLPGLEIDISLSADVEGLGTAEITEVLGGVTGGLASIVAALPDLEQVLGPLDLALRIPELLAGFDLDQLIEAMTAAVAPSGPGLAALVEAASGIGSVPAVGSITGLLGALGLDLHEPGALLGRTGNGLVCLAELLGGLLAVESASRAIETRARLAVDLLGPERIAGLAARVRAGGGAQLATLLGGIDPDDAALVELVTQPILTQLALAAELGDALVRGLAFAEAAVVDADFPALVAGLTAAGVALVAASPAAVRALVESAVPLLAPIAEVTVPAGGRDVVFGGVAELQARIEEAIDGFDPAMLAGFVAPGVAPVLDTVRAVRAVLDEIRAVVGVVFAPIEQALDAVDLEGVARAIEGVVAPVADTVEAITDGIAAAQGAVETAVEGVSGALTPVRTELTAAVGTLTAPFTSVQGVIAALDLEALQRSIRATLDSVTAAVGSAPVQPVFDVATGIIDTAADALGLVPKALLPDDLRSELEAACAPVEALDLEPARAELHAQLAAMLASVDAGALAAVSAGYAQVTGFVAEINPRPLVERLETEAFAQLVDALNAIDPTEILAPVLEALRVAEGAISGIDLAAVLAPVDAALDQVSDTIGAIDPTSLLAPVTAALDQARVTLRTALHLDDISDLLTQADAAVAAAVARVPIEELLTGVEAAWGTLVAELRGADQPSGGAARGLLAGLLPGVGVEGLPEVWSWIRGERDGSVVVRGRLERAAALLDGAHRSVGGVDVRALTADLVTTRRALTTALAAHPPESVLVRRLAAPLGATGVAADLGRVTVNVDRVKEAFAEAASTVAVSTAADRSEVQRGADGLATAFAPLAPALAKVRELGAFVGLDPAELAAPNGVRVALAGLAERLGPEVLVGTVRAVTTRLAARLTDLVHQGLVVPLQSVLTELTGLLDALSVEALLADFTALRTRLVGIVDGLRPSVALAAPLAAFTGLQSALAAFDPMGPVRVVVDGLRAEIQTFARDLAPSTLLAPVLDLYDEIAAAIGTFDVAGLLDPVLTALREIGAVIDRGMDEVIDALARLKRACESEGGAIPGLDISVSASVEIGGLL